jgi:hypothetical protein
VQPLTDGTRLFHRTTPLQDLAPGFEDSLGHAVDFYRSHDFDRAALAVEGMVDELRKLVPTTSRAILTAVVRFMVEREAESAN